MVVRSSVRRCRTTQLCRSNCRNRGFTLVLLRKVARQKQPLILIKQHFPDHQYPTSDEPITPESFVMVSIANTLTSLFACFGVPSIRNRSVCSSTGRLVAASSNSMIPIVHELNNKHKQILVVGDGDLSYSASIVDALDCKTRLIASVLEPNDVHERVYQDSSDNTAKIRSFASHDVLFGIDARKLEDYFPTANFDRVEFNFPHWPGKNNIRYNRELLDSFLKSATSVLKPDGEIHVALCDGQGGMPASTLDEWKQSWQPAVFAANHRLLLSRLDPYEPEYTLSSHRGVDRGFKVGDCPKLFVFRFPNGKKVGRDLQISYRHELRILLHQELLNESPTSFDAIVHGDAVFNLANEYIPEGVHFEIPARDLITPEEFKGGRVPLAVFLLTYSGASVPLSREHADNVRSKIEDAIVERWKLRIAKAGRLVSKPYPCNLIDKLIKDY